MSYLKSFLALTAVSLVLAAPAYAEGTATTPDKSPVAAAETQSDVNQQERIEKGLQNGSLTTGEAARLEKKEAGIDKAEAKAMSDGVLTSKEKERLKKMQDNASKQIYNEKHDAQHGNPGSASSERMQADVQRDVNQEKRIESGLKDSSLTKKEAAGLERGQEKTDKAEFRAGRDGHVGANEQKNVQTRENRQSDKIFNKRHNRHRNGDRPAGK